MSLLDNNLIKSVQRQAALFQAIDPTIQALAQQQAVLAQTISPVAQALAQQQAVLAQTITPVVQALAQQHATFAQTITPLSQAVAQNTSFAQKIIHETYRQQPIFFQTTDPTFASLASQYRMISKAFSNYFAITNKLSLINPVIIPPNLSSMNDWITNLRATYKLSKEAEEVAQAMQKVIVDNSMELQYSTLTRAMQIPILQEENSLELKYKSSKRHLRKIALKNARKKCSRKTWEDIKSTVIKTTSNGRKNITKPEVICCLLDFLSKFIENQPIPSELTLTIKTLSVIFSFTVLIMNLLKDSD